MVTLEQRRAQLAYKHITEFTKCPEADQKKYGSMVHAMPALIRSAGLSQALHFVRSRKSEPQRRLLGHLAEQLMRADRTVSNDQERLQAKLLEAVRTAELGEYLRLTQEALACVNWYRRFVQGELGIDATERAEER